MLLGTADWTMNLRRRQRVTAVDRLTETQRQCLRLTYQHKTSKQIAPLLGLSPHSVDAHIRTAMNVLGVDNRREAACRLHEFEAAQSTRRRSALIQYGTATFPQHSQVSEGPASAWSHASVPSNMAAVREQSGNASAMEALVEQSGPTGAAFDQNLKERLANLGNRTNLGKLSAKEKVIIILLAALLSAMAFSTIVSGFLAMSLFVTGGGSAR